MNDCDLDDQYVCRVCKRQAPHRSRPPAQIHLRCLSQPAAERTKPAPLTTIGHRLIERAPGDWLAEQIEDAGLKAAWENIIGQDCKGCGDRQQWLNRQWRSLVQQWFSVPPTAPPQPSAPKTNASQ